jgi:hypothetical protein
MCEESIDNDRADAEIGGGVKPPIEDLFSFARDPVDFMSAQSFPASDPPPPQSSIAPTEPFDGS